MFTCLFSAMGIATHRSPLNTRARIDWPAHRLPIRGWRNPHRALQRSQRPLSLWLEPHKKRRWKTQQRTANELSSLFPESLCAPCLDDANAKARSWGGGWVSRDLNMPPPPRAASRDHATDFASHPGGTRLTRSPFCTMNDRKTCRKTKLRQWAERAEPLSVAPPGGRAERAASASSHRAAVPSPVRRCGGMGHRGTQPVGA